MSLAILSAVISSLSLSLMILFDRLMMGDCYKNRPDHAWLVSSVAGATFGLTATGITWVLYSTVLEVTIRELLDLSISLLWPSGLLMIIVGAINIQVMRHYFRLFIPDKNQNVNETAVAMWLAAVPIFIFLATIALKQLPLHDSILSGLAQSNLSVSFGVAIVLAVLTMIGFEYFTTGQEAFRLERVGEIIKMIAAIVCYMLLSSTLLRDAESSVMITLALQPFYWIGFAAGSRLMLSKTNRGIFIESWPTIKIFLVPILIVEVIGMMVYYFEFFALSGADPTLVNLITGAHIIPVFILSLCLYRLRKRMELAGTKQQWLWGLSFTTEKLPSERLTLPKALWFLGVVATLLFALSQA